MDVSILSCGSSFLTCHFHIWSKVVLNSQTPWGRKHREGTVPLAQDLEAATSFPFLYNWSRYNHSLGVCDLRQRGTSFVVRVAAASVSPAGPSIPITHVPWYVEIRVQFVGVSPLLLSCVTWGSNSGGRAWWQVSPLAT